MHPRMRALTALVLLTAAPLAAQDTPVPAERFQAGVFALELPATWRRLDPNEALKLREQLPFDMREISPGQVFVVGNVDGWLRDGFDGRALLVLARATELPVDEPRLRELTTFWSDWKGPGGERREVLDARLGTVGPDAHPAHVLDMRLVEPGRTIALRTRDYYASTMGQQLILSFRAWENDWPIAGPELQRMADTLTFARPPREPEELGDRLLFAAIIGGVVGIVLLLVRKRMRQAPGR